MPQNRNVFLVSLNAFHMSGKHTALTYSTYTEISSRSYDSCKHDNDFIASFSTDMKIALTTIIKFTLLCLNRRSKIAISDSNSSTILKAENTMLDQVTTWIEDTPGVVRYFSQFSTKRGSANKTQGFHLRYIIFDAKRQGKLMYKMIRKLYN